MPGFVGLVGLVGFVGGVVVVGMGFFDDTGGFDGALPPFGCLAGFFPDLDFPDVPAFDVVLELAGVQYDAEPVGHDWTVAISLFTTDAEDFATQPTW